MFPVQIKIQLWKVLLHKISYVKTLFLKEFWVEVWIKLRKKVYSELAYFQLIQRFNSLWSNWTLRPHRIVFVKITSSNFKQCNYPVDDRNKIRIKCLEIFYVVGGFLMLSASLTFWAGSLVYWHLNLLQIRFIKRKYDWNDS